MFPNNGAGMGLGMGPPLDMPLKKRRSRKKKPVAVDPEAERQERELRMKIKQSLHTQQVLRTEVEEDEAKQNVINSKLREGSMAGMVGQANMNNMGNQMNNMMMGGMPMGFSGMQSQMGGMGMQQQDQQQQQQYQFNPQNQQYNYNQNQGGSGMSIPNIERQMQQMKQQLEIQRQQLEQQLQIKQQMELQNQMQQQQQQNQQQQQYQSSSYQQSGGGANNLSSEEIFRNLKYEQERLLNEAQNRGNLNNRGSNNMNVPQSPGVHTLPANPGYSRNNSNSPMERPASAPMCVPVEYQPGSNNNYQIQGGQSNQYQQSSNFPSPQLKPAQPNQQQLQQQYQGGSGSMAGQSNQFQQTSHFSVTPQVSNGKQQFQQDLNHLQPPPYSVQNQTQQQQQEQSYQSQQSNQDQQGGSSLYNQLNNGQYNQHNVQQQSTTPQPPSHSQKNTQDSGENLEKSMFSSTSNSESWLKASSINSSLTNSLAFHSVGNMSASFTSTIGDARNSLSASDVSEQKVPHDVLLENERGGEGGVLSPMMDSTPRGNGFDSKKIMDESKGSGGSSGSSVQVGQRIKGQENETASFIKGTTYTETNVALKPIQENEADDVSNTQDKFGQSSLMMSMLEGEFMQSSSSLDPSKSMNINELLTMSIQSQVGDMSMSLSDLVSSIPNGNQEEGEPQRTVSASSQAPKRGKQVNPCGSGSLPQSQGTLKSSSSKSSSVSMDDEPADKEASANCPSRTSKNRSVRNRRGSMNRRGLMDSKISMMSEISQWTKNNPFDNTSMSESPANGDGSGDGLSKKQQRQMQMQLLQGDGVDCPVDMGDFHPLDGSANSLDISMMSSMTGDCLSESLRALDLSVSQVERPEKKGSRLL